MAQSTALITGASLGIGRDLAEQFAKHGHNVILVARSEGKLRELAQQLSQRYGVQAHVIAQDLSLPDAAQRLYDAVQAQRLRVDILVNNAGFANYGMFHSLPLANQLEMIQLNVTTLVALTHLFAQDMVARRSGRILNVASTAAFQPGPLMAIYYATKAFVLHFSEAIHNELSPQGITVTALCPGPTESEFQARAAMQDARMVQSGMMSSQAVAEQGYQALMRGTSSYIPGWRNRFLAFTVRLSPRDMVTRLVRNLQESVQH